MRVLFAIAELYPWVKTGGLGDVAAALPPALAAGGVDVRLVLPGFRGFLDGLHGIADHLRLATPFASERVRVAIVRLPHSGIEAYLVDHPAFYDRPGNPYIGPMGGDWADNHRRFALFGWVAAALARGADRAWTPDILHGHDWHAGLAPAYLAAERQGPAAGAASLMTVHNLAFRGIFPGATFPDLFLPPPFFAVEGVEFYGQVSFLKAGLQYADRLTTVSPSYAREIATPAFGEGLDGLLRRRAADLSGILNGVDPAVWNPERDPNLPLPYSRARAAEGKRAAKSALQRRFALDETDEAPLFGVVSRLTRHKGLDLLLAALPGLLAYGAEIALLGAGEDDLERGFAAAHDAHPGRVGVAIGYDESLAHLIVGGADVILMPSRFEPCGLTQLYALRYGALPLVRRVGGLADTVIDATAESLARGEATGFAFDGEDAAALLSAVERAVALYRDRSAWRRMMRQAMTRDFSWGRAAGQYLALYESLRPDRAAGLSLREIAGPPPASQPARFRAGGRSRRGAHAARARAAPPRLKPGSS
jgi:starch synthase